MTLDDFTELSDTAQAEALLQDGVFVAERLYKNFTIYLYQIENFYVEVYYNLRYNVVQGLKSFTDEETLEPYLDSIDISEAISQ